MVTISHLIISQQKPGPGQEIYWGVKNPRVEKELQHLHQLIEFRVVKFKSKLMSKIKFDLILEKKCDHEFIQTTYL